MSEPQTEAAKALLGTNSTIEGLEDYLRDREDINPATRSSVLYLHRQAVKEARDAALAEAVEVLTHIDTNDRAGYVVEAAIERIAALRSGGAG